MKTSELKWKSQFSKNPFLPFFLIEQNNQNLNYLHSSELFRSGFDMHYIQYSNAEYKKYLNEILISMGKMHFKFIQAKNRK